MKYRELQAELKKRGLSAYGKKADLQNRLDMADSIESVAVKGSRSFVFTGDPNTKNTDGSPRDTNDPGWFYMHGYQFHLNGKPVMVSDEAAIKLVTHSHFTEQ